MIFSDGRLRETLVSLVAHRCPPTKYRIADVEHFIYILYALAGYVSENQVAANGSLPSPKLSAMIPGNGIDVFPATSLKGPTTLVRSGRACIIGKREQTAWWQSRSLAYPFHLGRAKHGSKGNRTTHLSHWASFPSLSCARSGGLNWVK